MVLGTSVCFPWTDKKEGTAPVGAHALTVTPVGTCSGEMAVLVFHGQTGDK